jgi:hypothetical protein
MSVTSPSWYERAESVLLLDYIQFGNTLRHASMEWMTQGLSEAARLRPGYFDDELRYATAHAVQQLGHAYEDLAVVMAGLTCRYSPTTLLNGKPTGQDKAIAESSLLFVLLRYKGTLTLDDAVGGLDAEGIAHRCGFDDLGKTTLPKEFVPFAGRWLLLGLARFIAKRSAETAPSFLVPFLKLKHGGVVVSDARLLSTRDIPADHIGFWVPGSDATMPKVIAIPVKPEFVGEAAAEVDRVRTTINVLVGLYLQRHFPNIWGVGHVSLEQMLDERVVSQIKGPCLIGVGLDVGTLIKATPI